MPGSPVLFFSPRPALPLSCHTAHAIHGSDLDEDRRAQGNAGHGEILLKDGITRVGRHFFSFDQVSMIVLDRDVNGWDAKVISLAVIGIERDGHDTGRQQELILGKDRLSSLRLGNTADKVLRGAEGENHPPAQTLGCLKEPGYTCQI